MFRWFFKKFVELFFGTPRIESSDTKKRIPPSVRNAVWVKYHGQNDRGRCYCCGVPVNRYHAGWHCSHVIPECRRGLTTVENLRVCCAGCNLSMGSTNMYAYIRNKGLKGPGSRNVAKYFRTHPEER